LKIDLCVVNYNYFGMKHHFA